MYCTRKVTEDLIWVGANDRRLAMFEGVYSVPEGVSYNAYILKDEKTVLFDTADKAVEKVFFENVAHALGGRTLDYIVVQHVEPDHSALLSQLLLRYPQAQVIATARALDMIARFYGPVANARAVGEGDVLETGRHRFHFLFAPMVHWPEVMVTYDEADGILFSADAFGTFGALNGALFADEVDFFRDYLDEARRYYTNIVGKYGMQVQALLKKASSVKISMICPLHGFVWRKNLSAYIEKYDLWSRYEPEKIGVMIAYASVYGNTENTAEILACRLRDAGIETDMYDVSVRPGSDVVSAAFKWSHLVFASTTYNGGIFIRMEEALRDLAAHNIQNRTVALIENGSWAPQSGNQMRAILEKCGNIRILDEKVTIRSALADSQLPEIDRMVEAIRATMPAAAVTSAASFEGETEPSAMFRLTYGLFALSAREEGRDNACVINTCMQVEERPGRLAIAVYKGGLTHDMIAKTGRFAVSVLTEEAPLALFEHFGFQSGRDKDKLAGFTAFARGVDGLIYLTENANARFNCRVTQAVDCGDHTLFVGDVEESAALSDAPSMSYGFYREHVKPAPAAEKKTGWVCKVCGYVYEGETLPEDFVCPLCKHGAADFEKME